MSKLPPLLVALALVGCSSASSVPVRGAATQTAAIDGDWTGTAEGDEEKVVSRISFSFRAGRHTGDGGVAMPAGPGGGEISLAIDFVEVGDGLLTGRLESYQHPACACLVETEFQGTLLGDSISGTFTTVGNDGAFRRTGSWNVARE